MSYQQQLQQAARDVLAAARFANLHSAGMYALANALELLADALVEPAPRRNPARFELDAEAAHSYAPFSTPVTPNTAADDELPF